MMKATNNLQKEKGLGVKQWKWPTQREGGV